MHGNAAVCGAADEIRLHCSNVTSIRSKAMPALLMGFDGVHFLVDTHADRYIMFNVNDEMRLYGRMNNVRCEVIWGELGERANTDADVHKAGIAAVVGPLHYGHVVRLEQGGERVDAWRSRGRLEGYGITIRGDRRHNTDSGESHLYIIVAYGPVHDTAANDELLQVAGEWCDALGAGAMKVIMGDFNLTF